MGLGRSRERKRRVGELNRLDSAGRQRWLTHVSFSPSPSLSFRVYTPMYKETRFAANEEQYNRAILTFEWLASISQCKTQIMLDSLTFSWILIAPIESFTRTTPFASVTLYIQIHLPRSISRDIVFDIETMKMSAVYVGDIVLLKIPN